jgi:hypothetical protein
MRTSLTKTISVTPETWQAIESRVAALRPDVASISHYFQRLVALELKQGLLGPVGKRVLLAGR